MTEQPTIAAQVAHLPMVAILRGITPAEILPVAEAVYRAGFHYIEVPFNSQPLESIAKLVEHYGERACCGAGTVTSEQQGLIQKVYEVDPLECVNCGAALRIIALIEDADVVERILKHLKIWDPVPNTRSPAGPDPPWPKGETLPLTYHPVPDIA